MLHDVLGLWRTGIERSPSVASIVPVNVVRWAGWDNKTRFATPADKNGFTWQLEAQITKGNGKLRERKGLLDDFKKLHKTARCGHPTMGSHSLPLKKGDKYVAVRSGYEWIRNDASLKHSVK